MINERFILQSNLAYLPEPEFGFNGFGEAVFYRTYSRIKPDGSQESWRDVVTRVVNGVMSIRKDWNTKNRLGWNEPEQQKFAQQLAEHIYAMRMLPPGRGLWAMGTEYVYERGSAAVNNCAAVDSTNLEDAADFAMDMLMCGVGVGFNTAWDGKINTTNPEIILYVIEDSREGWVASVRALIEAYTKGNPVPIFDYSKIRAAGLPIKGFGGTASGPAPLIALHKRIGKVLNDYRTGIQNKTRTVVDIFNAVGACVVAGNVRRCIPGYAFVHTNQGLIPIRDVKVGDKVLTMGGYENVTNKFIQGKQKLVKIHTQDGDFECTPNHRMAVCSSYEKYEWKQTSDLQTGDRLIFLPEWEYEKPTNSSTCKDIVPVEVLSVVEVEEEQETYDIEVENRHEFFCNGYLTHNSAEIALGDVGDKTFLKLKQDPSRADIAWMSNNSVVLKTTDDFHVLPHLANEIVKNGEPGLLNLINIQKFGRVGKEGIGREREADTAYLSNPCFSGDTLVAVADGRNAVSIKQLAEEGMDVPVYSVTPDGKVEIKWGRNPRMTQEIASLVEVVLDDDTVLRVTPDHKMRLLDGTTCQAKDLRYGDSLPRFTKELSRLSKTSQEYWLVYGDTLDRSQNREYEHRLIARFHEPKKWAALYDEAEQSGWVSGGLVIHHKDFNPLNNSPDNLRIMSFREHTVLHASMDTQGESNGRWSGFSHDEIKQHALNLTKSLGRRLSRKDWLDYAKEHGLPQAFSEYRRGPLTSVLGLACQCAIELGYEHVGEDPRVVATLQSMLSQGYSARIYLGDVLVEKTCEHCGGLFEVKHSKREQAFCSIGCGCAYINSDPTIKSRRVAGQAIVFADKQRQALHNQVSVYKTLVDELQREPLKKEWESRCVSQKIPVRFRTEGTTGNPYALAGYKHLQQVAKDYNHRVKEVRILPAQEPVYNLTVDDNHTFAVVTKIEDKRFSGVFSMNCGEIQIESTELCNLVEVFPTRCGDNLQEVLKFATFYASTVSLLPTHREESNRVIARNRRIGVSLSGIADWLGTTSVTKMTSILRESYKTVREANAHYAALAGVPESIRVTTIKPSGTVSLLAGVSPGIHFPTFKYAIRRMRVGNDTPICKVLKNAGVPSEPDFSSANTTVFEFPIEQSAAREATSVSAWEQFALLTMLQREWSDNMVSCTIYFNKEESNQVEHMLAQFAPLIKSVSMLPHSEKGAYKQMPYEGITKEEYLRLLSLMPKIDWSKFNDSDGLQERFCSNDTCTVLAAQSY